MQPKLALRAAACLLAKADLLATSDAFGRYDVIFRAFDVFMRLDPAAVRALNLLPSARDAAAPVAASEPGRGPSAASGQRISSLHCLISFHARTKGGRRLLRQWVLQPLTQVRPRLPCCFHLALLFFVFSEPCEYSHGLHPQPTNGRSTPSLPVNAW